jgi:hypothetical protein
MSNLQVLNDVLTYDSPKNFAKALEFAEQDVIVLNIERGTTGEDTVDTYIKLKQLRDAFMSMESLQDIE